MISAMLQVGSKIPTLGNDSVAFNAIFWKAKILHKISPQANL